MDKDAVLKIIEAFRLALEARNVWASKLVLFGSYAEGTFKDGSDIDLIVVSEDFSGKGYWERIDLLAEAVYEVFQPIEAVAMTPQEWDSKETLIAEYATDGEVVYAA